MSEEDIGLAKEFERRKIPYIIAYNKADLLKDRTEPENEALHISAATGEGIQALKERLGEFAKTLSTPKFPVRDQVYGFTVLKTLQDGDKVLITESCTHHR